MARLKSAIACQRDPESQMMNPFTLLDLTLESRFARTRSDEITQSLGPLLRVHCFGVRDSQVCQNLRRRLIHRQQIVTRTAVL